MTEDKFSATIDSPIAPSGNCFAILPHDTDELSSVTKALYVGSGGDVMLVPVRSEVPVLFANVVGGTVLNVRARAVCQTGTTASGIVGLA